MLSIITFISKQFSNMSKEQVCFSHGTDQITFLPIVAVHASTSVPYVALPTIPPALDIYNLMCPVQGENGILITFPEVGVLCQCLLAICIFSSIFVCKYSWQSLFFGHKDVSFLDNQICSQKRSHFPLLLQGF